MRSRGKNANYFLSQANKRRIKNNVYEIFTFKGGNFVDFNKFVCGPTMRFSL